jgi:short subunit dehydrogenase-like uncharacterized protein
MASEGNRCRLPAAVCGFDVVPARGSHLNVVNESERERPRSGVRRHLTVGVAARTAGYRYHGAASSMSSRVRSAQLRHTTRRPRASGMKEPRTPATPTR